MTVTYLNKSGQQVSVSDITFAASNPAVSATDFRNLLRLDLNETRDEMRDLRPVTWTPGGISFSVAKSDMADFFFMVFWHSRRMIGFTPLNFDGTNWAEGSFEAGNGTPLALDASDGSPLMMDADNTFGASISGSYNDGVLDAVFDYLQLLRANWKFFWGQLDTAYAISGAEAVKKAAMLLVYEDWRQEANWPPTSLG